MYTQDSKDRVREAADIVEIVSAYTDLRQSGGRFTGLCPFHDERSPSFSVNASEKLYHCFGCQAGGDVFSFVMEKEGIGFTEAIEVLADRYGVEIERESADPRAEEARKRRVRLGEALARAAQFYAAYLWEAQAAEGARAYLAGRGLGEEILKEFGVGMAPNGWDSILVRGQRAGFTVDELRAAGLVQDSRQGRGPYDFFRARITFPIRDARGRVQGFGARALKADQTPKYRNSPEGELYRKSRTLFGIDIARAAIARARRAIVVEGYTDVLALHQAGIRETVAIMGTAITPDQVAALAGHAEEVVLALDADAAGREAMIRAQRVAGSRKVRLRVAAMEPGLDPADMLAAGGADRFRELVDSAQDLPVFQVRTILDAADLDSTSGRDRALDAVAPILSDMPESITRDELMREVGSRLSADPGLVARRVAGGGGAIGTPAPAPVRSASSREGGGPSGNGGVEADSGPAKRRARELTVRERRERALLAMCIAEPGPGRDYLERITDEHLSGPVAVAARDWLRGHLEAPLDGMPREDEEFVAVITQLVMNAETEPAGPEQMELNFLELERGLVEDQIAEASRSGEDAPVELYKRRAELADRLASGAE